MSELSGMTGFARVAGEAAWGSWAWEAKSVNGRSLDVRVNTPPGFDALDRAVKAAASKLFNRGSLQVSLRIDMSTGDETVTVNEGLLTALTNAAQAIHGVGLSGEAIATLMTLKGVVETGGSSLRELAQDEAVIELLSDAANAALKDLAEARRTEGASLTGIMTGLVGEMEGFAAAATKLADSQPGLLKARLTKQLDELDAEGRSDARPVEPVRRWQDDAVAHVAERVRRREPVGLGDDADTAAERG